MQTQDISEIIGIVRQTQEVLNQHTETLMKHTEAICVLQQQILDQREKCSEHCAATANLHRDIYGNGSGSGGVMSELATMKVISGMKAKGFWLVTSACVGLVSSLLVLIASQFLS